MEQLTGERGGPGIPHPDGPGNAAYRRMLVELAQVQAREQGRN